MPHFVIDCSKPVLDFCTEERLLEEVFLAAESTQLFEKTDIKVRINSFNKSKVGDSNSDFIHVFCSIMEGRTGPQKSDLHKQIIKRLSSIFPEVPNIAMNISEFQKSAYLNRNQYELLKLIM